MVESTSSPTQAFPNAVFSVSREEFDPSPLEVIDGSLPTDLYGHLFIMGPAGDGAVNPLPDQPVYPASQGVSLFAGDAMVTRLDFDQPNQAMVTRRLLKTPCFYADQATAPGTRDANLGFFYTGIGRYSFSLGFRNMINTACIPFKSTTDHHWRLLATWDAGRPYEIDPLTLEAVTPLGWLWEWKEQALPIPQRPFPLIPSATHHVFDNHTGEFFGVNWGKSLATMASPVILQMVTVLLSKLLLLKGVFRCLIQLIYRGIQWIEAIAQFLGFEGRDFVNVFRWDGEGELKSWQVVLPNRFPVQLNQSLHQIGVTRNYLILMDTAFKLGLSQLVPNPLPGDSKLEVLFRELIDYPQCPDTTLYLIRRSDLKPQCRRVTATKAVIPREIAHFLVDYNDDEGIVLHVAHNSAWDPAEWPQGFDDFVHRPTPPYPLDDRIHRLIGMTVSTTDLNALGRYQLNPETGDIESESLQMDPRYTWAPAIYTSSSTLNLPERYDTLFWNCWGCWPELLTQFMVDLYGHYKYRELDLETVLNYAEQRVPPNLCRLDVETMQISDTYSFPPGHFGTSPQFIPRQGGSGGSSDGYLLSTVFADHPDGSENTQFWIFDAGNLSQGPVCKLAFTDELNLNLTIHTTWLPDIAPRTASYYIPVREDYQAYLNQVALTVRDQAKALFEKYVYPHFEPNTTQDSQAHSDVQ